MFLNRDKKVSIISAVIFVFMLSNVGDAMATALKFCPKWKSQFGDSGLGEDYMTATGAVLRPAFHTRITIEVTDAENVDYDNPLDLRHLFAEEFSNDQCVAYDNTKYNFPHIIRVTWHPDMKKGDARVVVPYEIGDFITNPQPNGGPDRRPLYVNSYSVEYYYPGTSIAEFGTIGPYINDVSFKSNMAALGGLTLAKEDVTLPYNDVGYPDNLTVIKNENTDDNEICTGTAYQVEGIRNWPGTDVCVLGDDYLNEKFGVAHEIGHRLASTLNGPKTCDNYDRKIANSITQAQCTCDHLDSTLNGGMNAWHCLQSREGIGVAQCEGWAHFYATAVFNLRDENDGWFGYYKKVNIYGQHAGSGWDWGLIELPPYPVDATRNRKHMENNCPTAMAGVERDWLNFFYNLWQDDPIVRLDMTEIANIWDNTYNNENENNQYPYWDNIHDSAADGLSPAKYENFNDKARNAGVRH